MASVLVLAGSPTSLASGGSAGAAQPRAAAGNCVAKTPGFNQCRVFRSNGAAQTFTTPAGATSVKFHLWGSGGGQSDTASSGFGGGGGYTVGTVAAPLASSYTITIGTTTFNQASAAGGTGAGGGGGRTDLKDNAGALLMVAGGGGGGGRGTGGGSGGAGGGEAGEPGGDAASPSDAKGGGGASGTTGGTAGALGTRSGKAGANSPDGKGGAGGGLTGPSTSTPGGGGGGGFAGGAGGDGGTSIGGSQRAGAGGGGGTGFVDTTKVPDGTTSGGSGRNPGGTDDPFFDNDKYGNANTPGAAVVEWSIPTVDITSPKAGDVLGSSNPVTFTGTGLPGSTVTLSRSGSTVGSAATVAADGTWTIQVSAQSTGTNVVYTATQTSTGNQPLTDTVTVNVVTTGTITGSPVTTIQTTMTGACQAFFNKVAQFFGSPQSCATAINTGSNLWGAAFFNNASAPTAISQTPTTGSGTSADPFTMTTVFSVGSGAVRLSQTETYVNGDNGFRVDITVTNRSTSTQSGNVYRGGDCLLAGVDRSFGAVLPAAPGLGNGIACVQKVDGTGQAMLLVPLTPGSSYAEGALNKIRDPASTGKPLTNTCDCTTELDSGMGISWPYSLPAGASATFSHYSGFRPDKVLALESSKTVTPSKVQPGETVTYTVRFSNPNTSPMNTFGFTDTLDPRLDYVPGSTSGSGASSGMHEPTVTGSKVAWGGFFTLAKGPDPGGTPDPASVFTFTFQAKVKDTAAVGTARNDFGGDGIAPLSQVAPVLIGPLANLTVTKSVDKSSVLTGGQAVFTLTVKNDGPNAATNIVLTDKLPTGLTWVSDDSGGKYTPATGAWSVPTLAKDATATLKITVKGATEGDYVNAVTALTSDSTNTKALCTDTADPSTCPNAKITVRSSDLVMTAATAPNPVPPGGTSIATLTVTNNGPSATVAAATVALTLPQRTTPGSPLPAGCVAAADGKTVTCTVPAGLANGAKADFAIPLVVASNAPLSTALTGGSVVVASVDDVKPANNTAAVTLSTAAKVSNDLAMSVTVPTTPVTPGTTATVTGTVTNGGPSDTTSASTVTFTLPANTTAAATQPSGCTVASDKKSVTCTIAAGLKNAATASFAISVLVDSAAPLDTVLSGGTATVANTDDPVATNNSAAIPLKTAAAGSADLSITKKAAGTAPAVPGGNFVYDIVVANAGPSQAVNVVVTDALPVALKFVSSDAGCTASGQTVTCGSIATLNVGATKTIKITVQLDPAYSGDGSDIKNQASVKSDATDPNLVNNTSDASTGGLPGPSPGPNPPTKPSADLAITKKAAGATAVAPGQSFIYDLTVTNGGLSQAKNVTVTDVLPSMLVFQPSAGCTASGQTVTCGPLATLDPGKTQVFKVTVQLDPAYAGDGSNVRNQASVKSDTTDPNLANNTSDASTGGLPGPGPGPNPPLKPSSDLSITKAPVGTAVVAPGGTYEYLLTVANAGPSQAKNVVVTDTLQKELTFVSSADGCAAAGQLVTCTGPATLDAAATKTYKIKVQLAPAYAGDGSDIKNQVSVKSDTDDPNLVNNTSDASTGGLPGPGPGPNPPAPVQADVAITKKPAGTAPVAAGESFDYAVTVTNNGPSDAKGLVVTDALPVALKFVSASDGCTAVGQDVTCPKLALLAAKASKTYTIKVQLDPAYTGDGSDVKNQAKVATDSADPDLSNNTSDAATGTLPGPGPGPFPPSPVKADVAITKKAASTAPVAAGESFDYTVTVTNNGPSDAKGLVVTDALPAALKFVSASDGCTATGQNVTCPKLALLAAKGSKVYTIKVQLDPAYAGDGSDVRNQAKVATDTTDPDLTNNTSDASTGGLPGPGPGPNPPAPVKADVAITKKAASTTPVAAGESFDYTVTVTNNGPSEAKGLVVTDALPAALKFVSASDGCTAVGQNVTCPKLALLAAKGSKVYTIKVQLDPAYAGDGTDVKNQAKVATDTTDPDLTNNTSDASTGGLPGPGPGPNPPSPVKADVAITKKPAGTAPVAAGESFDYAVTVTNNGPSDAKGLVVTDALPVALKFVSASDGCTAVGQDVSCPKLATLAAKASKTYTIKVQLDPAYTGDGSDVKNQAKVATDSADPDPTNNTSDAATGTLPGPGPGPFPPSPVKADVAITKKASTSTPVAAGESFDYTVTVTNNGPSQASGLVVTDALPAMLKFVSASDGCTAAGQNVTCPKLASLAAKASKTYTIKVQLDPAYTGDGSDVKNQAKVATDSADPDQTNNTSDASTGGLPGPGPGPNPPAPVKADVAITKKPVGTTPVAAGESFDYAVTVTNNGPSEAKGLVVTDALPATLKFVSASDGCTAAGQNVTCPKLASLAAKASKTYTIKVQLDPAYTGDGSDVKNQAKVATDTTDPDQSNNTSDAATGGLPGPGPGPNPPSPVKADVAITKKPASTTPIAAGESFDYTVTVTNNGPSDAKGLVVTDALPAMLKFVSSPDGCTAVGQDVSCPKLAALAAKGSKTYTITVQLDPAYAGDGSDVKNQAKVATDTTDPDPANNTSDASTGGLPGPGPGPNPPSPVKADVAITKKAASTAPVAAGESFDYTVTVTNNGPSDAKGLVVTDALPAALKFVSASDGCTATDQNVTCPKLASLAAKASKTYTITVQLDPAYAGDGSDVRNQAKVATDTADPDLTNNTSDASTGGLPGPGPGPNPPSPVKADVAITKKAASNAPVAAGESFDYTITVTNNGPSQASGLVVTDALPAALKFVSASDGCTAAGQNVSCPKLATLAAKASKTYTITVQLDPAYAGDGTDVRNQAKVATDSADPDLANNTSDASTGGLPGPGPGPNPPAPVKADVAVTKKPASTNPVSPGESFDYTVTVTNNGPSEAKGLVVTDALPSVLKFVSASDGCTVAGQDVSCPKLATLAAKASKSYTIKVQLDPAYTGDGSDVKNQAKVATDTTDPDLTNNTSDAATGTLPGPGPGPNPPTPVKADVAITKKASASAPVAAGESFEYTVTVTNNGPSDAKGLVVTDALPAALKFVSASDGCTASGQDVTCPKLASLAAKASKVYTITVQLDPAYAGDGTDVKNQAKVATDTTDPDQSNNTSDASTGGLPGPGPGPNPPAPVKADVAITKKAASSAPVAAGETFDYSVTVTNNGPSEAKGLVVTDALPAALKFVSASDGCTAAGQNVTCPKLASLAAKGSKTYTIKVQLDPAYAGDGSDVRNQAKVATDTSDPDASNNTSDASTGGLPGPGPGPNPPTKPSADLSVTKRAEGTASVAPGQSFVYVITVTNGGPSQAKNVTVTDSLPVALKFVSSDAGCTASGQTVTCGPVVTLDAGATTTVKLTVQLDPAYSGDGSDIRNQASVKSDTADPDMSNNTSDASTGGLPGPGPGPNPPTKPSADLSVTKKAEGTTAVTAGQSFVYDITVANAGPSQAKNVTVTDVLPAGLIFQPSAGCTASGQTVTCGPVATLDTGKTQVFKVTVQLDPAYSGDGSDIRNQASVKSDTTDPDMSNNTSDASTGGLPGPGPGPNPPLKPSADVAITKKAASTVPVAPGESFDYTVTVTNNGPSRAEAVVMTDTLPAHLVFVSASDGCTASGQVVTCPALPSLAAKATHTYTLTVQLDPAYSGDGSDIRNQASVKSDTADPDMSNNTSDASTGGLPGPDPGPNPGPNPTPNPPAPVKADVAITKKPASATAVAAGESFDYTVTVTNNGPSDAKGLVVTDALPVALKFVSASDGCTATGQDVSCPKLATLAAKASKTYTIKVQLDPAYTGDGTDVRNQAKVATDTTDPDLSNNTSDASTGTLPGPGPGPNPPTPVKADVAITKKPASATAVAAGESFDYTVTVTNNGPSDAKGLVVTDALPSMLKFVSASDGCTASGQDVTCPKLATLAAKASKTYTITVQLDPAYAGDGSDVRNQAKVATDTADPDQSNNTSDAATGGLPGPGPGPNPPTPVKADVAITKKPASAAPVAAGESFDYTITVTNNGPSDAKGLVVTDALPAMLKFVSASDSCTATGQDVTCPKLATLAAKASKTYTIKVQLDPAYAGDGTDVRNQAKVATDTTDPDLSNNTSDASTGTLPGPGPGPNPPAPVKADVAIAKKPVGTTPVAAGESFDYAITVTNNGPSEAKGLVVTDALPAMLKFVSASDSCTATGQDVTCPKLATLAAKASKTYTITVQLDPAYAGDGSDVKNQAKVATDTTDPDPSNNTSDASTGGLPGPDPGPNPGPNPTPNPPAPVKADVAITKKPASATAVAAGESFDYTVTVTNNGPSEAKGLVVTDALPVALKFVSASDGCTATGQDVTCPKLATLAAKGSKTYTIKVQLDPAYTGDGSDVRNQAKVATDTTDPDLGNNTSDASTGTLPGPGPGPNPPAPVKADVAITKKPASATAVAAGESFDYTVTVTNNGPSEAKGLVVTDALPSMLKFVSASDGCTASGQDVSCPKLATLAAKASKTYTIKVQLDPAYAGDGADVKNQAKVATDTTDPDQSNNTSDAATGGLPGPGPGPNPPSPVKADVAITKKPASTTPIAAGESFDYTVTVTNNGPSDAKGLVVTDALPAMLKFVSASDGCTATGQDVSCPKLATLAAKASKTYTITVQLDPAYVGDGTDVRNQAKVATDTADPDPTNNTSDASTGTLPGPGPGPNPPTPAKADVAITKKPASATAVAAGESFDYTITVTNNGPSEAKGLVMTDALPAALKFVSASDGCTAVGQDVSCPKLVSLAAKASKTYTIKVQLDPAYTGDGSDVRNQAKVATDTADPDLSNNTSDASTGTLPGPGPGPNPPTPAKADVAITKKPASTTPVAAGESFDYTITVTNNGPSDAKGLVVTDALPAMLKFVSASDGCTAVGQDVTCPKLATLAAKGSKTYTITVQLDPAYAGDGTDVRNQAKVATDTADPDQSNNTSDASTGGLPGPAPGPNPPTPAKADVAITKKAASTTPVAAGESFDYAITVTNNGPSDAKGLVVTDALPAMLKFVSASDGCTAVGQDVSCPKLATLAAKASKTYTITVQLDPAYAGDGTDVRNQAKVATDTADPDLSNNTSDASTGGLPGPNPGPGPNPPAPVKADVAITKKPAATTPVAAGESFDYTVTVTNNGPSQASGLVVTDALPAMLKFVSASDGCTATGQDVTCPKLATLAAKGSKTYTITVQLDPAYAGDGTDVRNQAKVATDTADPDQSNNTSDASTGGLPGPGPGPNPPTPAKADVAITKKPASTTPVAAGESFDYAITVTNNGPSEAKGLVVTDALPVTLKFVSASDGCTVTGQDVTCPKLATLAAKGSKTYTIKVQLDPAYSGDGSDVRNQAKVATDTTDPDLSNNTSDASTGTLPGPGPGPNPPAPVKADVAITKKPASTTPVAAGESFDYAITVTNNGPSEAKGLVVTDALPAMLKFVSASDGCTVTGQDVTCPKLATLAAKASKTYTITVQLDPAYAGDGSDVKNQAKVATDTTDPDQSNNTSDASTGGLPGPDPGPNPGPNPTPNPPAPVKADVAITKKPASAAPVAAGEPFDYTVTVTNNGPSDAKGLVVTDALPAALKFVSASDGCTATGQDVTCPKLATLAAKASKTYTITVQLDPAYSGDGSDVRNQAKVATDTTDPDPANNTSDASTGTLPGPGPGPNPPNPAKADVAVTKKPVGAKQVAPGETFEYQVTVTNNGPAQASEVKTTDALPAPLAFVSSTDGCTATGQDVTCPTLPVLAAKGSKTFTFTVRLDQDYEGNGSDIANIAKVAAATADPDLSNNSSATAGLPLGKPRRGESDLAVDKTSSGTAVAPGENVDYTITVTNNGPTSDSYHVVLTDQLPAQLSYISSQPAGCTQDTATRAVTCPAKGRLKVGEKFTYVLTTRLDPSYTGDGSDIVNRAVVQADNIDPNPTNDTHTALLPDGGKPAPLKRDMAAQAILAKDTAVPGETVNLTARITNHGPSTHTGGATFAVTVPAQLSFAQNLPGNCTADSPQKATCTLPAGILPQPRTKSRAAQDGYVDTEFALRVSPDAAGGQTLTGTVRVSDPIDRNPANDEDTYSLRIAEPAADLALAKSAAYPAGKSQVDPGDTFTYTLTTTNHGPSTAVNAKVTDPLPAALSFVSSPDGCTADGRTVTCGPIARLAPGDKAVHRILVKLDPAYAGDGTDVDNIATATSDTPDPDKSNNSNKPGTNNPDGGPLHTGKAIPTPKPLPHTGTAVTLAATTAALLLLLGLAFRILAARRRRNNGRSGPA
ncbi:DUF11 domain-containing protein [Kitasatospora sp. NBC_00070]|uniref:hypothetical protein n=1 Tax=Kitasatospora sp. NBC_00070 TaxID=2975962 RepID=UPI003249D74A